MKAEQYEVSFSFCPVVNSYYTNPLSKHELPNVCKKPLRLIFALLRICIPHCIKPIANRYDTNPLSKHDLQNAVFFVLFVFFVV